MEGVYTESGLTVDLRGKAHFRFQDCPAYIALSGQKLKEMDFGWWHEAKGELWLLELKDYSYLTPQERLPENLLEGLATKAVDSLMMLASVWSGTTKGQELQDCLPEEARQRCRLKLLFVLKCRESLLSEIPALRDKLNQKLKGRLALFDIQNVTLAQHKLAIEILTTRLGVPLSEADPNNPVTVNP